LAGEPVAVTANVPALPTMNVTLFALVIVGGALLMVRIPVPVDACPSGFVIVMFFAPGVAATVETSSVTDVGSLYVMPFTVTPPETLAWRRFVNPAPGSKKPLPPIAAPVIVMPTDAWPGPNGFGDTEAAVAGGGASNFATRTP